MELSFVYIDLQPNSASLLVLVVSYALLSHSILFMSLSVLNIYMYSSLSLVERIFNKPENTTSQTNDEILFSL